MNVIVQYDPYNRVGNRMFQYAFSLLLAKKYNCKLYCNEGLPNFSIPPVPFNNLQSSILTTRSIGNHYFNFNALNDFDGDIIMNSWAQKAHYYTDSRDFLRNVFGIKNLDPINNDSLVLHVRGTDYNKLDYFLGYEFYKRLIKDSQFTKIKIVTDDPNCDTVKKLISDGCTLETSGESTFNINGDRSAMNDMKTLLYSENIAISQSSFSWWPAFLGYHQNIIFPYSTTKKQIWPLDPKKDDIDLFFDFDNTSVKYIL